MVASPWFLEGHVLLSRAGLSLHLYGSKNLNLAFCWLFSFSFWFCKFWLALVHHLYCGLCWPDFAETGLEVWPFFMMPRLWFKGAWHWPILYWPNFTKRRLKGVRHFFKDVSSEEKYIMFWVMKPVEILFLTQLFSVLPKWAVIFGWGWIVLGSPVLQRTSVTSLTSKI